MSAESVRISTKQTELSSRLPGTHSSMPTHRTDLGKYVYRMLIDLWIAAIDHVDRNVPKACAHSMPSVDMAVIGGQTRDIGSSWVVCVLRSVSVATTTTHSSVLLAAFQSDRLARISANRFATPLSMNAHHQKADRLMPCDTSNVRLAPSLPDTNQSSKFVFRCVLLLLLLVCTR